MDILKNIRETALTHPKRYAVQSREQKLTYEELEEYSNRLAVWIAKTARTVSGRLLYMDIRTRIWWYASLPVPRPVEAMCRRTSAFQ